MRRLLKLLLRPWWLLNRGMTLGVRAVVARDGKVFLVRHSYLPGWYLPGGGVERGETVLDTLTHELRDEGNIVLEEPPRLFGVYSNETDHRGDHVVLFVAGAWRQDGAFRPTMEIVEAGFFALNDLPEGTTPATRRRLAEVFDGALPDTRW
ncbi:NUDIX domain-containing protein [Microbaculum sp. FT89]|uniref:NUDIX domain-containing protein n=1 Tax=Microbaculum sp. FT89 TaxID=3447298 RepID=UPI003F52E0B4